MTPLIAAVVPAAGSGERLGAGIPKALALVGGEPILAHAVRALVAEPRVGLVVIAAPPGLEPELERVATAAAGSVPVRVVTGGATRVASVTAALAQVPVEVPVVLVHDAARCLVPVGVVARVADAVLAGAPGAVPVVPVIDTIRQFRTEGPAPTMAPAALGRSVTAGDAALTDRSAIGGDATLVDSAPVDRAVTVGPALTDRPAPVDGSASWNRSVTAGDPAAVDRSAALDLSVTVDRSVLRAVQTPQGFATDVLREAHAAGIEHATDDAGMVEALGHRVQLVDGDPRAFKVTTRMDLLLAEALLADRKAGR